MTELDLDEPRDVTFNPTAPRGSDRSFMEAQKLGLLGRVEPDQPRAPRTPASISELAELLRDHKSRSRIAREFRAKIAADHRAARNRKAELTTSISEDKASLVDAVGTAAEGPILERLARTRLELQGVSDRLDALTEAQKRNPDSGDQELRSLQQIHGKLLQAIEQAEIDAFPADALAHLHATYAITHGSSADWQAWLGQALAPPDTRELAGLRAAVLARHNAEV